jgi:excisionase family DNA binding protein
METYLTIEEVAKHLKLAGQTIRRYVLNREIPYHKIMKVIRFRLSEIESWIDSGGVYCSGMAVKDIEGDLFADVGAYCPPVADSEKAVGTGEPEETGSNEKTGDAEA